MHVPIGHRKLAITASIAIIVAILKTLVLDAVVVGTSAAKTTTALGRTPNV